MLNTLQSARYPLTSRRFGTILTPLLNEFPNKPSQLQAAVSRASQASPGYLSKVLDMMRKSLSINQPWRQPTRAVCRVVPIPIVPWCDPLDYDNIIYWLSQILRCGETCKISDSTARVTTKTMPAGKCQSIKGKHPDLDSMYTKLDPAIKFPRQAMLRYQ